METENSKSYFLREVELRLLAYLALGRKSAEIAKLLSYEKDYVKKMRARLLRNLGVRNTPEAVAKGFELRLLPMSTDDLQNLADGYFRNDLHPVSAVTRE